MSDQRFLLSWAEPYYPLSYQDEHTGKLKGSSVKVFELIKFFLKNISYEYVHYEKYREPNRTMCDLGGAMGAIVDGKVLTELSGANVDETYHPAFGLSPAIGSANLDFYVADSGAETWSPLSYLIVVSLQCLAVIFPFTFTLIVICIVIVDLLQVRNRKHALLPSILLAISSAIFLFGMTILMFAYNAGYQGNMIAADPVEKITWEELMSSFASGKRIWYFRTMGLLDFSSISYIPITEEENLPKLINLVCENPGKVVVSMYSMEFLQMKLYEFPSGCRLQKVNLVAPVTPSLIYWNFEPTYYYFLLPKKLPRRLSKAINFVINSVFQADQRDGYFTRSTVDARSFVDITPVQLPLADYAPLSIYSIGVMLLIVLSLQCLAVVLFVLEIIVHRWKLNVKLRVYCSQLLNKDK